MSSEQQGIEQAGCTAYLIIDFSSLDSLVTLIPGLRPSLGIGNALAGIFAV